MRKSGLHKQISSIFDGVPMPKTDPLTEADEDALSSPPVEPAAGVESVVKQDTVPTEETPQPAGPEKPEARKSSLIKRLSADPSECASSPSIQVDRPMPLSKSAITPSRTGPGLLVQAKKAIFGKSGGTLDARQKKMAALVGVLSVVFGIVMFASLGGVGGTKAVAAENSDDPANAMASSAINPADWKHPEPLPGDLRDAAMPLARKVNPQESAQANPDGLIVKGIVFSKNKPSAIINNEIYTIGQHVNGVLIKNITRESVEFEASGKRWQQQIQR